MQLAGTGRVLQLFPAENGEARFEFAVTGEFTGEGEVDAHFCVCLWCLSEGMWILGVGLW